MDKKELEELKWSQYKNRPSVEFEEDDPLFKDSLALLEMLEERSQNGIDVINWDEKAEMDRITQSHPEISVVEDDNERPQNINENDVEESNNHQQNSGATSEEEQDAMNYLAGVMGQLEGYDDKQ